MFLFRLLFCFACTIAVSASAADAPATSGYDWPNLTDFLKQLIDKVGAPVKVYRMSMDRDGKVDLWIQDQRRRDLVDSYEYEDGAIKGPIPIKFEHYPSVEAIDLERGDSSGFLTYSDVPIWTFHLDTARHDGRVEFSLDGKVLDADKD